MSKKRMIDTKFWSDNYISELDPSEKLLFLYFITNPFTNICGIYEITLKQIALDTGFDKEMIFKILERFSKDGKIYYINGWVCVKNFSKHQILTGSVEIGINKALALVPPEILANIKQLNTDTPHQDTTEGTQSPKLEPELEPELQGEPIYEESPKDTYKTKEKIFNQLGIKYEKPKRSSAQKNAWDIEMVARKIKDMAMEIHRIELYVNKSESGKGWKALKKGIEVLGKDGAIENARFYLNSEKFDKFGADLSIMFSENSINLFLQKDKIKNKNTKNEWWQKGTGI